MVASRVDDSLVVREIMATCFEAARREEGEPYEPAYDPWRGLVSAIAWVDQGHAVRTTDRLVQTSRPRTRWLNIAASGALSPLATVKGRVSDAASLPASRCAGIVDQPAGCAGATGAAMGELRKITVQVPEHDLDMAQAYTGEGVTETVRAALPVKLGK